MKGQTKRLVWALVLLPAMLFNASVFAEETADKANNKVNIEWTWDNGDWKSLESVETMVDDISGIDDKAKAELKSKLKKLRPHSSFTIDDDIDEAMIPIAGILLAAFCVSIPFFIVLIVLVFAHRKRRQRIELISRFIEKGQEVPKELLVEGSLENDSGENANMKRGLTLMGIGLGLYLALGIFLGWELGALGLIPFFIGLARFSIWLLENRKAKTTNESDVID